MLRLVDDDLKTKQMLKHAVKKLAFAERYETYWYKTQQICDKAVLENGGTLESVPDRYKTQKYVIKTFVIIHVYALEFAPDCYKTEKCLINPSILILLQFNFFADTQYPAISVAMFGTSREHWRNILKERNFLKVLYGKKKFVLKVYDLIITNVDLLGNSSNQKIMFPEYSRNIPQMPASQKYFKDFPRIW